MAEGRLIFVHTDGAVRKGEFVTLYPYNELTTRAANETGKLVLGHRDIFSLQDMAVSRLRFVHTDGAIRNGECVVLCPYSKLISRGS